MELKERQDICQDTAISLWQKSILSVEEEYERQQEVLMVGDTCIGTLGNFSASIGKAKSKKTSTCRLWSHRHCPTTPYCAIPPISRRTNGTSSTWIRSKVPTTANG